MNDAAPGTPRVNLYLVGFMGTGKTTVGRLVAQRLHLALVDSDAEIEKRAGRTIAEIFATQGEEVFRRMEREFIDGGHPAHDCVVSCGGGLVLQEGVIPRLRERGVIICLMARAETILRRTETNRNRPLLEAADPLARIRELIEQREPIYRSAGTQVLTDFRPLSEVVAHVQRIYLRESRDFRPPSA
jgi:shikimate kinase